MAKQDFLRECMSEFKGAPIDAFNREFCAVCSNRGCSRSWGNASGFDTRVKNWRTVLFEKVPRIVAPDLANPNFAPMETTRVPEVQTQTFETSASPLSFDDVPDTEPGSPVSSPPAAEAQLEPRPGPDVCPPPAAPAAPPGQMLFNTPFKQPVMLGDQTKMEEETPAQGNVFVFDDD
jgi:hypothetical protein